jgi:hypothetical protein
MVADWKAKHNRRQYLLIADRLRQFEEGGSDLQALVSGLDALLSVLESPGEAWAEAFRSEWGTLETVYAVALDRKEQGLAPDTKTTINDPSNRALVTSSVQRMMQLVQDRLGSQKGELDSSSEESDDSAP